MSATIQIGLTPQAEALLERMATIPRRTLAGIARGQNLANQETIGVIQKQFLSFPKHGPTTLEGLRAQTNRLRGSIRASKATISGNTVTSGIGSNVKYAAVHEFGFRGTVMVPAHTRKAPRMFLTGGRIVSELTNEGKSLLTARGKVRKKSGATELHASQTPAIDVKAHSRKMDLPARAPIRRGIIRNLERTREIVSAEIIKSLEAQP